MASKAEKAAARAAAVLAEASVPVQEVQMEQQTTAAAAAETTETTVETIGSVLDKNDGMTTDGMVFESHLLNDVPFSELDTSAALAADDGRIPDRWREAIMAGDIMATIDSVKVDVKNKKEPARRIYVRLAGLTRAGCEALVDGRETKTADGNGFVDYFNYGFDLGVRGQERNKLMQSLEGPEKAIERSVKAMGIAGIPRAIALKMVVGQLIEQGELPADYVFPEA
jgi:hypothetical protein